MCEPVFLPLEIMKSNREISFSVEPNVLTNVAESLGSAKVKPCPPRVGSQLPTRKMSYGQSGSQLCIQVEHQTKIKPVPSNFCSYDWHISPCEGNLDTR